MSVYRENGHNPIKTCAFDGCGCTSDQYGGVDKGENWFCSQGCSEGSGCDHADCHCNRISNHNPEEQKISPAIPGSTTKPVPADNPGQFTDHNPAQGSPATRRQP